jgi:regulatory protein
MGEAEAWDHALRLLGRKPRTEAELRMALGTSGHGADDVECVLVRLVRAGYVNDRALAVDWILARSARLGYGRDRLMAELERRGVAAVVARAAWDEVQGRHGLDPDAVLGREIARRAEREGGTLAGAAARRVYNALLRAGHAPEAVRAALEPHLRSDELDTFDERDLDP